MELQKNEQSKNERVGPFSDEIRLDHAIEARNGQQSFNFIENTVDNEDETRWQDDGGESG